MRNSGAVMFCSLALFVASALVSSVGLAAEEGSWSNAGEKAEETATAVGDATANTAEKAWDATKEGASQTYNATKQAVQ